MSRNANWDEKMSEECRYKCWEIDRGECPVKLSWGESGEMSRGIVLGKIVVG